MDINAMLEALYRERNAIEEVIKALTRLNADAPNGVRRGRPPKWLQEQRAAEKPTGKRKPGPRRRQNPEDAATPNEVSAA